MDAGVELDRLIEEQFYGRSLRADTPGRIGAAVMNGWWGSIPRFDGSDITDFQWRWNDHDYKLPCQGSKWDYGEANENNGYGLWFWDQRIGQSYQADIEAHVAAWRYTPPAYSSDRWDFTARQILDELHKRGYFISIDWPDLSKEFTVTLSISGCWDTTATYVAQAPSLAQAICLAALQTVGINLK